MFLLSSLKKKPAGLRLQKFKYFPQFLTDFFPKARKKGNKRYSVLVALPIPNIGVGSGQLFGRILGRNWYSVIH
jgi:hypothetical protein